ncbi:MAG: DUF262 domain-containing protein [Gammaproteobacteria bacterium]|nr:DUF262 domain-containing protein [Gammaproteobacteria bacterium]
MSEDINELFRAHSRNVHQILYGDAGYFVPVYQRPYAWPEEKITQLFDDIVHGLKILKKNPRHRTFLGTIICINDNENSTVKPAFKTELPDTVMTIIDGQQRLTTFVVISAILHDTVRKHLRLIDKRTKSPAVDWLRRHLKRVERNLWGTLVSPKFGGDELHDTYPKITRAVLDVWSTNVSEAKYSSPVGKFLRTYLEHKFSDGKDFKYTLSGMNGTQLEGHKYLLENYKKINKSIGSIVAGKYDDLLSVIQLIQSANITDALFGDANPDKAIEYIIEDEEGGDQDHRRYCDATRLLVLADFFLQRVVVTRVVAMEEDYAFDMFESLNTTGEPLTAIETFKPKIIADFGEADFEGSSIENSFQQIETYLGVSKKEARTETTSAFLVSFGLLMSGEKQSTKLVEQRRYLRDSYASFKDKIGDTDGYMDVMGQYANFLSTAWSLDRKIRSAFSATHEPHPSTLACLEFFRKTNHKIVAPLIFRFFYPVLKAKDEKVALEAFRKFEGAVKAVAAFSTIWRTAKGGTSNIDQIYRQLVATGRKGIMEPLAINPEEGSSTASLKGLKAALRDLLETENLATETQWIEALCICPVYQRAKDFGRFLLFIASHDHVADDKNPGFLTAGIKGSNDILSPNAWVKNDFLTVEHIAPQSGSETDWPKSLGIYKEPYFIHLVGNLTLLPHGENLVMERRSWEHKRKIFDLLSTPIKSDFEAKLAKLRSEGVKLSSRQEDIIAHADYLKMCSALSQYPGKWNASRVLERTKEIGSIAWKSLEGWLK